MGVKEFVPYLKARQSNEPVEEVLNQGIQALRSNHFRYAKKQIKWIRGLQAHSPIIQIDLDSSPSEALFAEALVGPP